ncbi:MAG TPA: L,D-transpeptidase family protein [Actinomycetota bacterium]|nr:L,D-transpeptidase family protein [Actinomycetota bacterium]
MRRTFVALAAAALLASVLSSAAAAQETPSVTLEASATTVVYGDPVTLSGAISPATGGQTVELRDDDDAVLETVPTDPDGTFSAELLLDRTTTVRAVWDDAVSEPVTVKVRATVTARMGGVRLFDTVGVRGTVSPVVDGGTVAVTLLRSGERVETKQARIGSAGGFSIGFRVMDPGTYRARAVFADADHLRGVATTGSDTTPLPRLRSGSKGVFVRLLEIRLRELNYRIVGIDQSYDHRTGDAVAAFRKVQGMAREFAVTESVWRRLADPRIPKPRLDMRRFHIEVDQTRQVLYTVVDREVTNVIHVSTGAGGATRDGRFRVYRKLAGFSPNRLYYPSYFDGLRAIHGWTEVPTYPASHGCVRVPYWHAKWIFRLAEIGTTVAVYHS